MTPALVLAFTLMTAAPANSGGGEPLPPGAPTDSYQLAAWCYGALDEYLTIYERVIPDLRAIDAEFGPPDGEAKPYAHDMAAARVELKMIGDSVTDAEKASPQPISEEGAAAVQQGRSIWSVVEAKPHRQLARAWMLWALPDRCDSNARELTARSQLLGKALSYNAAAAGQAKDAAKAAQDGGPAADAEASPGASDSGPGSGDQTPPPASDQSGAGDAGQPDNAGPSSGDGGVAPQMQEPPSGIPGVIGASPGDAPPADDSSSSQPPASDSSAPGDAAPGPGASDSPN